MSVEMDELGHVLAKLYHLALFVDKNLEKCDFNKRKETV
jgi:hypothetical protein